MSLSLEEAYREGKKDLLAEVVATLEDTLISDEVIDNSAFGQVARIVKGRQHHVRSLIELLKEKHGQR
jgi:hypothetical protein